MFFFVCVFCCCRRAVIRVWGGAHDRVLLWPWFLVAFQRNRWSVAGRFYALCLFFGHKMINDGTSAHGNFMRRNQRNTCFGYLGAMITRASCVELNGAVREVGGHRFLLYCRLRGACGSYRPPQRQCALGLQCKPARFLLLRFCPTLLTGGSIYF